MQIRLCLYLCACLSMQVRVCLCLYLWLCAYLVKNLALLSTETDRANASPAGELRERRELPQEEEIMTVRTRGLCNTVAADWHQMASSLQGGLPVPTWPLRRCSPSTPACSPADPPPCCRLHMEALQLRRRHLRREHWVLRRFRAALQLRTSL